MAGRDHIWLLAVGDPPPSDPRGWLRAVLSDPDWMPVGPSWLRGLLAWWYSRRHVDRLGLDSAHPQLMDGQRQGLHQALQAQAAEVQRLLFDAVTVRPVLLHGPSEASPAAAAATAAKGDRVVLLAAAPQHSRVLAGAVAREARQALTGKGVGVKAVTGWPTHAAYIEALAGTVRTAIADVPADAPYAVVFVADRVAAKHGRTGDPYAAQCQATVDAVVQAMRLGAPYHLAYPPPLGPGGALLPDPQASVQALAQGGARHVILAHLSAPWPRLDLDALLGGPAARAAKAEGAVLATCPPLGMDVAYTRALIEVGCQALGRKVPWA